MALPQNNLVSARQGSEWHFIVLHQALASLKKVSTTLLQVHGLRLNIMHVVLL